MRVMAGGAAFYLQRGVFEDKRTLLIRVALEAGGIRSGGQPDLFLFEATVWIVAIAALHHPFEHSVMKRPGELRLCFIVAGHA
jgi:hypothetical protein